jgi:hypothetical protein
MIASAEEKRSETMLANLEVSVGQFCGGSLPEGPFDVILGFNLLHLLQDRRLAFEYIAHELQPGGPFISKTTCLLGAVPRFTARNCVLPLEGKSA